MNLPSKIKVAGFDFRVEEYELNAAIGARQWGLTSFTEMNIRVQTAGRPPISIMETLIHEIGHAIWWSYHVEKGDDEERMCGTMASAWVQIYRDNPILLDFFKETLA